MAELLALAGVTAGYGETVALEGIGLSLAEGESVSVIGRNGVGKSTLLATLMGHTTLHAGSITLAGARIEREPPHRRAQAGLGYVPQEREIFPSLTVRENLEMAMRPGAWTPERVYELFPNLKARLKNAGNQLSGGEQQMLTIARALLTNPRLVLMDEPTEGLAPVIVEQMEAIIAGLKRDGIAMLLVEQRVPAALRLADIVIVMSKGRIVFRGTPDELRADRETREKYLGL